MAFEITCPHCGRTFEEDESKFASIVAQVHDAEFERALNAQVKRVEEAQAAKLETAVTKALADSADAAAKKDEAIAALRTQLEAQAQQAELTTQNALAAKDAELAELRNQLKTSLAAQAQQAELETQKALAAKDAELAELRSKLSSLEGQLQTTTELEVTKAVAKAHDEASKRESELVSERDAARHQVELVKAEGERALALAKEELAATKTRAKEQLAEKDETIEQYRDLRSRLNTKLLGETLEQHCEIEYEKLRTLFGNAEFHKDNEAIEGTKGDYIFRDFTPDGTELISIMFEMKNEQEDATHHKKNVDHLRKLDADRRKKNCEYAVLVSTLEPQSELYNQGIVDVSHKYEKMYVIRPQFFIPIITLLRNAALKQVELREELEQARAESIDITNFEDALNAFKDDFAGTTERAGKKFADAIDCIDKAIADLEKAKAAFVLTEKHLNTANNKADKLTIRKLTKDSPLLRERFAEIADTKTAALPASGANSQAESKALAPDKVE